LVELIVEMTWSGVSRRGGSAVRLVRSLIIVLGLGVQSPSPASAAPVCEPGKGYVAVDASQQLSQEFLDKIKSTGIATVIRYYDWTNETLPGKTLTLRELKLIADAGMSVAVVFQHNNDCLCTFMTKGRGRRDAERALELAKSFSQPAGSAVYFGVDGVDAQFLTLLGATGIPAGEPHARKFIERYVRAYFDEVAKVMKSSSYKIGVYGSGLVCSYLLDEKLVHYCWLANATSWPGYQSFEATKRWVLKQHLPTRKVDCFGVPVDLNSANGSTLDFGQWKPKPF
jgi:glycoside hydrolase-like protein